MSAGGEGVFLSRLTWGKPYGQLQTEVKMDMEHLMSALTVSGRVTIIAFVLLIVMNKLIRGYYMKSVKRYFLGMLACFIILSLTHYFIKVYEWNISKWFLGWSR